MLSESFRRIAETTMETECWPASKNFVELLTYHANPHEDHQDGVFTRHYTPPVFDDGLGPLALVALSLDDEGVERHNPESVPIIRQCLDQFESFEHDLRHICGDRVLHVIPAEVPHLCLSVYNDHPLVLPFRERDAWKPTDAGAIEALVKELSAAVKKLKPILIRLNLEAIVISPDGSMIAGFVCEDGAYESVMNATSNAATKCLGSLKPGPRNCIHVTLGRILGFGDEHLNKGATIQKPEQDAVRKLIFRYNTEILPRKVASMTNRTWRLQHVSLLRNTVWLCEENIVYKTWSLTDPS